MYVRDKAKYRYEEVVPICSGDNKLSIAFLSCVKDNDKERCGLTFMRKANGNKEFNFSCASLNFLARQ